MIFLLILLAMPVMDLLWWRWADARLKHLRAARWRAALGLFVLFQIGCFVAVLAGRMSSLSLATGRLPWSLLLLWHLLVLPITLMLLTLVTGGQELLKFGRWAWLAATGIPARAPGYEEASLAMNAQGALEPSANASIEAATPATAHLSRRQFLAATVAAAPPLLTLAAAGFGTLQLDEFRVRELAIDLPQLPQELDGLVIAHVSDSHVGQLTHGPLLDRVARAVNAMDADLILFTGDLINDSLSELPAGLDMLHRMRSRYGIIAIEGNHDLFESREGFEQGVISAGIRLLLDESATINVRGQRVQVLGLQWGGLGPGRGADYAAHFQRVRPLIRLDAFPILLSHYPDAFDLAADVGIPLTLSGHTHGGQLMLTKHLGPGPLMYKYWSGLYRKGNSATVVSNGVGNWFPLRLNAPAEIARLTLRRTGG